MDNQKNIIAAIALSSAILVLWALFFSPDQPTKEQLLAEKEKVENPPSAQEDLKIPLLPASFTQIFKVLI